MSSDNRYDWDTDEEKNRICDGCRKRMADCKCGAVQAEDYDTCDRCYKRITGDELKRANRRSDYITYCDECNRRNNGGVALPDNLPLPYPRRAIPSGFEQLPAAISDMAPIGAR